MNLETGQPSSNMSIQRSPPTLAVSTVADPGGAMAPGPNFAPFANENMYQTRPLAPLAP